MPLGDNRNVEQMPEPAFILQFLAAATAVAYLPFVMRLPTPGRSALKTLPAALLTISALLGGYSPFVIAALAACAAGDYFLSLEGEGNFLSGLGAFLAGHMFYMAFFARQIDLVNLTAEPVLFSAIILTALIGLLLYRLWPYIGHFRTPVIFYSLAIAGMAVAAKAATPSFMVLVGIALFIVSDIVIALDRFTPLSTSPLRGLMPYVVWILYAAAQIAIVYGLHSA